MIVPVDSSDPVSQSPPVASPIVLVYLTQFKAHLHLVSQTEFKVLLIYLGEPRSRVSPQVKIRAWFMTQPLIWLMLEISLRLIYHLKIKMLDILLRLVHQLKIKVHRLSSRVLSLSLSFSQS